MRKIGLSSWENQGEEVMLCIPGPLVAHLRQFFAWVQQRGNWETREDWYHAYQAVAELERSIIMGGCAQGIIDELRNIYRLLDSVHNGRSYVRSPGEPPVGTVGGTDGLYDYSRVAGVAYRVAPSTSAVPHLASEPTAPGVRARLERLIQIVDNEATGRTYPVSTANPLDPALENPQSLRQALIDLRGILDPGWFGIGGTVPTIADLVRALRAGDAADKTALQNLLDLLSGASSAANLVDFVRQFLSDGIDTAADGLMLAAIIGSSAAQVSATALVSQQLTRLINSIDGGGLTGPSDNVLMALRGTEQATALRNIIDTLAAGDNALSNELLEEIRDLLQ